MAIVKMKRFSLFVFDSDKAALLHELQKFKYVHFTNLNEKPELKEMEFESAKIPENIVTIDEEIAKIRYGIDVLSKYDARATGLKAMKEGKETLEFTKLEQKVQNFNYSPIYEKIREINKKREGLKQEREKLQTNIDELMPWVNLDVATEELASIRTCKMFVGTIPQKLQANLENKLLETQYTYFEAIGEEKGYSHIVVVSHKDEADKTVEILREHGFSEMKLNAEGLIKQEIENIRNKIKVIEEKLIKYEDRLKELVKYLPEIERQYDYYMNKKLRVAASENFLTVGNVNIIEGYVPEEKVNEFTGIIEKTLNNLYYLELDEVKEDDPEVPILLKNSTFARAFESITAMYSLPKYNEIDPTPLLAPFYALFFGMMVADIGYGLLLFIGTFIALKKFNLSESQKDTMRFYLYGSITTMFWGAVYGSFLGGVVTLPALIDPAKQYNLLLLVSIALGIVHVFTALGIKAYINIRNGKPLDALYDAGFWYMALGGAILLILSYTEMIPGSLKNISTVIMVIGMAGIVLTGGRDAATIGGKLGGGLYSLYGISGYIGDFVSYSRLMALGLSGAFIASAINMMVTMLLKQGILGILGGIVVFGVGQAFNIFLSVLGGYVHTIRLTYVEFFGKFYEGGGKAFRLFQSKPKYINIK